MVGTESRVQHSCSDRRASGFVVLDVDGEKGDTRLLDRGLHTPATVTVKTPRGYHYWLSYPSGGIGSYTDIFGGNSGIDIRGDGGYVVVPGSVLERVMNSIRNSLGIGETEIAK